MNCSFRLIFLEILNTAEVAYLLSVIVILVSEPDRRFIDGKWFCEDGYGGFLVFEEDKWITYSGDDMKEKWNTAEIVGETSDDPYRCVVDGVTMEWNQISQQWLPVVEVSISELAKYYTCWLCQTFKNMKFSN